MKRIILNGFIILSLALSFQVFAKNTYVNGYFKSNGTYVAPHYRTSPDATKNNNWSTKGNINPYTGKKGTVSRYKTNSYNKTYKTNRYNKTYKTYY